MEMVSHTQPMPFTAAADCDLSREDSLRRWLALHTEPPLEPELPFVDCHHHLMDHREPKGELRPIEEARPEAFRLFLGPTTPMYGCRYLLDEYAEDIATSGHVRPPPPPRLPRPLLPLSPSTVPELLRMHS